MFFAVLAEKCVLLFWRKSPFYGFDRKVHFCNFGGKVHFFFCLMGKCVFSFDGKCVLKVLAKKCILRFLRENAYLRFWL